MHLLNETLFEAMALPLISHDDVQQIVVAAKGSFTLAENGRTPALASEQTPLHMGDVYWGEPQSSSLKYETDIAIRKPGTDIAVIGSAWAAAGPVPQLDVGIRIGRLQKIVRVFGDRFWRKSGDRWVLSPPQPFETLPLTFENAYGGADPSGETDECYALNPVGKGFVSEAGMKGEKPIPAPNLECREAPIASLADRPEPAGFGFVARHWLPRRALLGTYDDAWREERNPLLPADFDERAYSAASPGLFSEAYFTGGETVVIINMTPSGRLEFPLPSDRLRASVSVDGQVSAHEMSLDTVVVEPDAGRIALTWRVAVPCHWNIGMIDWVKIGAGA